MTLPRTYEQLVAMSKEDILAYFDEGGDFSALFGPVPAELPVARDPNPMRSCTVRLPVEQVDRLEREAPHFRGGRSGIVRQALAEYFEQHEQRIA